MNDFKKRRLEYTKKLVENTDVLNKIEEDYGNSDKESDKRIYQILIAPCNLEELEIAENLYTVLDDIVTLCIKEDNYDLKSYDPEDNLAANVIIKVMESLYNGEEVDMSKVVDYTTGFAAKFMLDSIRGFCFDTEETFEYMAKKLGVDTEDDFETSQFIQYFEKATDIIANQTNPVFSVDNMTKKAEMVKDFTSEFHKLCEDSYEKERNVIYRKSYGTINRIKFNFI